MPRTSRTESATGIYHVMMRGVNLQNIFDEDRDYLTFLKMLSNLHHSTMMNSPKKSSPWSIYAYALMSNHFHLLIQVHTLEIGVAMQKIASAYAGYFNLRYGRVGHLFQGRFKSEPCNDNDYFLELLQYIHQNPMVAGLCRKVSQYPYTSWHEYFGNVDLKCRVCEVATVLKIISLEELKTLIETKPKRQLEGLEPSGVKRPCFSDDDIVRYLREEENMESPGVLQRLGKDSRNRILRELRFRGARIRQLQRLTGLGYYAISHCGEV